MIRRPGTAVAGDNTNKTIAIACVALMIFTVAYVMISAGEESEAETVRYGVSDYYVISGQGKYTDSSLNGYDSIYITGTSISNGAFKNCTTLIYVRIDSTVKTIGDNAFEGCTSLSYVGGSGVTTIGKCAFKNSSVRTLNFESSLTTIGENAFQGTSRLANFPLWNTSVTEFKNGTFMNSGLQIIDMRNITSVGSTAFSGSKVDLQIVRSGQTTLLPGICRLYCDDDSLFYETDSPIRQVSKSGQTVTFTLREMTYLKVTAVNGSEDLAENKFVVCEYYAKFKTDGTSDYTLSARPMEIHIPEGVGVDALVKIDTGDLPYKLPVAVAGKLTFSGWKVEGSDDFITEITATLMRANGGRIVMNAEFGKADVMMDHSSISDRTDVSTLQIRAGFTLGGKYPKLPDVNGYRHIGWMVDGEQLAPEAEITKLESHTAYSIWSPTITYKLTYLQSDGSVLSIVEAGYNETIVPDMGLAAAEEEGKRHIGWSVDGTTAADKVRVENDMSLMPVFGDRTLFKVSVKDRGETLSATDVYDGRKYTFCQEDPFSPTQVFLGWTDGIVSGTELVVESDITIESEWRDRAAYKVSYREGRSVLTTATALEGIPFEIAVDDPVREGMNFYGWYDESDNRYAKGDKLDVSADTELFTEWTDKAIYFVTYYSEGDVKGIVKVADGSDYLIDKKLTRDGYAFKGWSLTDGGEVSKVNGDMLKPTADVALYAVWDKEPESQPSTDTTTDTDGPDEGSDSSNTDGDSSETDGGGDGLSDTDGDGSGSEPSGFAISGTAMAVGAGVAAMVIALLAVAVRRA